MATRLPPDDVPCDARAPQPAASLRSPSAADPPVVTELAGRPARPPAYADENRAIVSLAREMAESPKAILQKLADSALELCHAGSAGISLLEFDHDGTELLRWHTAAGAFAPLAGRSLPRNFSPSGVVLDRDAPQLFVDPARTYPYIAGLGFPVAEVLLVPFHRHGRPAGTVWVVSHSPDNRFDAEDARLLTSLSQFASAATETLTHLAELQAVSSELADIKSRLEAALDAGAIATWSWDIPADRVIADAQLARLFSVTAADAAGAPIARYLQVVHPDDRARVAAALAGAAESGDRFEEEYRLVRPDGSVQWVIGRGQAERDQNGRPVRFPGVVVDVTRRKQAEADARQHELLLRQVFESVKDYAIFTTDVDGRVTSWNVGAERIFGYPENEILGQDAAILWPPDDRARGAAREELDAARDHGCANDIRWHQRKDGQRFYATGTINPIHDAAGTLRGFTKICKDITRQREVEAERERLLSGEQAARADAEAANQAKDRFLADLSHELRTPLSPVLMTVAAMLENHAGLDPASRSDLEMVRRNLDLEVRLIDDLLDVSRVVSGKLRISPEPVRIHPLIDRVADICRDDLNSRRIKLDIRANAGDDHVLGDPARLHQVLWNLLKNAVKFSPEGSTVTIATANPDPASVEVRVADRGVGIDPATLPKLFGAFEQGTAAGRRTGGLGLGLAIAKAIVESHGGSIRAESPGLGQGATFVVRLPVSAQVVSEPVADGVAPEHRSGGRLHLLLVEDHEDTARALARLLQSRGYEVETATTVAAAIHAAGSRPFDLVISDIGLPDATGYDLMRELSAQHHLRGIALSGFGMEDDLRKSRDAGFIAHLVKPVTAPQLEQVIRSVTSLPG